MRHPLYPELQPVSKADKLKSEVEAMIRNDNWNAANPTHIVLLHCLCHERVYGVETPEKTGKEFVIARTHAARILRDQFHENNQAMVEFIQWFWRREQSREKWRRDNNSPSTFRADWRIVFNAKAITDYRLDIARNAERLIIDKGQHK